MASISKGREGRKRLQETHISSLNGCIMHAQPMYANSHLKPVKFIMASLLVVKVMYFFMIFFSFAAATSLVSEAREVSEKSFSTIQNHFRNIK